MKYSIIIATYNRLEEIKELISSVESLKFSKSEFEIIISDDGSSDGTKDYLEKYETTLNLRYIYQQNKGPGEARNQGMQCAKGTYFLFVDSDCLLPGEWLQKIDAFLSTRPLDAFGGPDTYHPSFPAILKAINYSMTSFIGTGGARGAKKSVTKFYPRSFNMGIKREVYEAIGGMGKLRHGQDMEYSSRIYKSGFTVGLIPDAFVYHKRRTNLRKFFKQVFNWGVTRINLGKIDKQMLKPLHYMPALLVFGLLLCILIIPFYGKATSLWLIITGGSLLIAVFAFFQSWFIYKELKVALLSVITLFIQVFAYGMGMLSGIFQTIMGTETAEGFTKNYYK